MTELSFLLDLLLNEKLSKAAKEKVTARIRDIEQQKSFVPVMPQGPGNVSIREGQPASTQRLLEQSPVMPPQPTTVAAAQALAQREAVIQQALSGKSEPGRTSPRKF